MIKGKKFQTIMAVQCFGRSPWYQLGYPTFLISLYKTAMEVTRGRHVSINLQVETDQQTKQSLRPGSRKKVTSHAVVSMPLFAEQQYASWISTHDGKNYTELFNRVRRLIVMEQTKGNEAIIVFEDDTGSFIASISVVGFNVIYKKEILKLGQGRTQ